MMRSLYDFPVAVIPQVVCTPGDVWMVMDRPPLLSQHFVIRAGVSMQVVALAGVTNNIVVLKILLTIIVKQWRYFISCKMGEMFRRLVVY